MSGRAVIFGSETIVGSALHEYLIQKAGMAVLPLKTHQEIQLESFRADIAFNATLQNYGLNKHIESPAELFETVYSLEGKLLPLAFRAGIKKYVNLIPNCVYPANIPVPFQEEELWNGAPEISVSAYAHAKRNLIVQANAYRKQYGYNAINLIVTAVYGPNDSFDPKNAQVIPSMIVKLDQAIAECQNELILWGSGNATREFIFVDDLVEMIWLAASKYNGEPLINLCTGVEVPIKELASMIKELMGYEGNILWDQTKPEGIRRKCLSPQRFSELIGSVASTTLKEGLLQTINWYYGNLSKNCTRRT